MSQFFEELQFFADHTTRLAVIESFAAIILSFILSLLITWVYKLTHKKGQYSQSFIHTIIIMSVVVSVIMIVIGNNIAVAFGLVGAFSIIRFRSAMSDPKDIAFIFFGMATGIACGLGFYILAVLFAITLSIIIYILFAVNYGTEDVQEKTLKVTIPENLHYEQVFDELFDRFLENYTLLQVETTSLGTMYQLTYSVTMKDGVSDKEVMDAIREHNANLKVSIIMPSRTF
ncbi:DUF4956 domain-containing protein [Alkalihalobacillus sp. MEB130]|uniref:DUF4956 domain-containing protein n=1 Tax=Alkalihalobacillus sp. MEB130 TaxID=2976704 RepID=UPI0028DF6689|nr:DUF4956 domain-containing protein [Alkalihalobacillus sp. MEB130]MDT8858822.1 DUF4956 domain-containing protein [Alkalihalobacillus sp. MEB130]